MRMLMIVTIENGKFNDAVRNGTAASKMKKILDSNKPESAIFTDHDGHRAGFLIVNLTDPSQIPALAEPWFLTFDAKIHFKVVMTPEDLAKGNLDSLGKQWA